MKCSVLHTAPRLLIASTRGAALEVRSALLIAPTDFGEEEYGRSSSHPERTRSGSHLGHTYINFVQLNLM